MSQLVNIGAATRRSFMSACAGCLACAWADPPKDTGAAALMPKVRTRLRLVFAHPEPKEQGWPYQNYDYEGRKAQILSKLARQCPGVEFQPVSMRRASEAEEMLKQDAGFDGYLVYILGIPSDAARPIALSGKPTLLVDDLYGGTGSFLGVYPAALKAAKPVAAVSSTRFEDVAEAVHAFVTIRTMKASRLLLVTDRDMTKAIQMYRETLGVEVVPVEIDTLNSAWRSASEAEARQWAEKWTSGAGRVVEPKAEEIRRSAAMYVGMRGLLAKHGAQGIAVDCLRLFYGNKMFAYPCLGFFQLNNDGLVGACEADLQSASTMLLITYLTGRPGYISDPVIDTSKNQIIYAHCVAPNKVYGPSGAENAYELRDHSEDRKGAAIRSLMPLGQPLSNLEFVAGRKTVVFHASRSVDNIDEDRACRTKLAAEVKDARKLMSGWDYGWHRVTVYGDWRGQVETVTRLMGWNFVEEG